MEETYDPLGRLVSTRELVIQFTARVNFTTAVRKIMDRIKSMINARRFYTEQPGNKVIFVMIDNNNPISSTLLVEIANLAAETGTAVVGVHERASSEDDLSINILDADVDLQTILDDENIQLSDYTISDTFDEKLPIVMILVAAGIIYFVMRK